LNIVVTMPSIIKSLPDDKRRKIIELFGRGYSTRQIAELLTNEGYSISHTTINRYLRKKKLKKRKRRRTSIVLERKTTEKLIEHNPNISLSDNINEVLEEWFKHDRLLPHPQKTKKQKYQNGVKKSIMLNQDVFENLIGIQEYIDGNLSDFIVDPSNPKLSLREWFDIVTLMPKAPLRKTPALSISLLINMILDSALR